MDAIFGWLCIFGFFGFIGWIRGKMAASRRKDLNNAIVAEKAAIGDFRIRAVRKTITNEGYEFEVYEIQVRGAIPVEEDGSECSIMINMYDETGDGAQPVLCVLDDFQEKHSRVYQLEANLGPVPKNVHYKDWVKIGVAIIDTLIPPRKGIRQISFQACLIPVNNPPLFKNGFVQSNKERIWAVASSKKYSFEFDDFGYLDAVTNRKKTEKLTIELAFYVAAADGVVAKEEGGVIKAWASRLIADASPDNKDSVKNEINASIKQSYEKAVSKTVNHVEVIFEMSQVATKQEKYEAIELCLDVMSADGHADPAELKTLDEISKMLEIDPGKFRALQDRRLANVESIGVTGDNIETLVGITNDMSPDDIRKHLSREYRKWNSRVTSGDEKVKGKAQEMLLLIGDARAKYVSMDS
jgi:tellurite resistance protein